VHASPRARNLSFSDTIRGTRINLVVNNVCVTMADRRSKGVSLAEYFFAIISIFSVVTLFLNVKHGHGLYEDISSMAGGVKESLSTSYTTKGSNDASDAKDRQESFDKKESISKGDGPTDALNAKDGQESFDKEESISKGVLKQSLSVSTVALSTDAEQVGRRGYSLAGLSCQKWGGPLADIAQEMVYWEDIPSDNQHVSPLKRKGMSQYLTFESDHGGFNNIRMAMETVLALSFAMGRTLVLPPEQPMYLIRTAARKDGKEQRNKFSFNHFFHMEAIHNEHPGLDIITMKEFLEKEAMVGNFRDANGKVIFPPKNQTDWDGSQPGEVEKLYKWLRDASHVAFWDPDTCPVVFPASLDPHEIEELNAMRDTINKDPPKFEDFIGKPTPVNGTTIERLKESLGERKELCIYDDKMQASQFVHAPVSHELGARLLVHFYAFLFFQDWRQDLWMKRFIRDHVRYVDEIQCAAARVVGAVRQRARARDPGNNPGGLFDTFHIRRGDFQFKRTRVSAKEIYEQSKKVLAENATIFVATDERDKTFFDDLRKHYDVVFLDDFLSDLGDVNTNYYGMIDQLVASRGRNFLGCWFSTFTVRVTCFCFLFCAACGDFLIHNSMLCVISTHILFVRLVRATSIVYEDTTLTKKRDQVLRKGSFLVGIMRTALTSTICRYIIL
jgi:hypothetical protein